VGANEPVMRILDASSLWLELHVPDVDAASLETSRGGWVEVEGLPETLALSAQAFVARAPAISPETHTIRVVYSVPNPDGALAAGTLATAHLYTGEPAESLVLPAAAIVEDGPVSVVYVQVEGEAFERRVVRVRARERDLIGVDGNLLEGEHVVVRGAYGVRLAASSGSVPAHGHAH
jgi:multidrug efflux pump subunit AcrA (membrane-fusion protein)